MEEVKGMSHTSDALLILARSHDQLATQINEQRRINERMTDTIHDQSLAITKLAGEVSHLSEAIREQSKLSDEVDTLDARVNRVENEMKNFKFRTALFVAVVLGALEVGIRAYDHMSR